jgi:DNA invertase Pin-like site-specific DNA recombinase
MDIKRIAIFAGVSTPQQASIEKDSLPSQIRDGKLWADSIGGDVVAVYEVPGHTRKYIFYHDAEADMEAYRRLREDAEDGRFDVLWCRSRDRLGRTTTLIHQIEAIVANADGEVYSAAVPHAIGESSRASNIFLASVETAMAESENVERARRHREGLQVEVEDRQVVSIRWGSF